MTLGVNNGRAVKHVQMYEGSKVTLIRVESGCRRCGRVSVVKWYTQVWTNQHLRDLNN